MVEPETDLEMARRPGRPGEAFIAAQRAILARLRADGHAEKTAEAASALALFEETERLREARLARLEDERQQR